jgi:hypothetical protein
MVFKQIVVVAVLTLTPIFAFAEPGPMQGACMSDIKSLCGSIQPGGGRIRECMREHRAQLSNNCKLAIADRVLERRSNQYAAAPATAAEPASNSEDSGYADPNGTPRPLH